ncbi:PLP-dependent aminotransferase family protein [Brevibacillus ruminantium]|uniref:PLP-dependent aminotransferase family protein n=1 Tax=Brevibacillus ruminantium TaxID=2950604 RepID=A0ABY4WGL0_9BACL|nr:PLP-dependent aminotransferase family protein [Brevibacillus ruminantium]USG66168.1 PLP-dependent aminotransferase family protein [Brevibacillus ruminantium]
MATKYAIIMSEIKKQVENGTLGPGKKLPSVRELSERYACSKNTIIQAYHELEKEHVIYSVPRSGHYVVNRLRPHPDGITSAIIDFLSAGPDHEVMPYLEFQHCINQAIDMYKDELFHYTDLAGIQPLRLQVSRYLQNLQVFSPPERVFVTSGVQQALHILIPMPFPNGKRNILVEQPTYFGMIESAQLQNVTTFGIDLTMDGLDFDRLEFFFRHQEIKFFYTVPRFHNPLGHSYTNEEKKRIVRLAQKYDVYIVEDDFLGELDPNPKSDPLFSYDPDGRVIYLKSFSKIMLPGLRVAVTVLPTIMTNTFLRYKFSTDFMTSALSQGALEIYIKSGMLQGHLKRIKVLYHKKMQLLLAACEQHLPPDVVYTQPASGFYSTIFLPGHVKARRLAELLQQKNIYVDDARRMFLPEFQRDDMIRLSISQVSEHQIEQGVKEIGRCIRFLLGKRDSPSQLSTAWL